MNKKNIMVISLATVIYISMSILNGVSFGATFREGVFEVTLPASFERASKPKVDELRKSMMGGSRELAEASKLVNPRDISDKGVAFLSVFQNQNGKLLLMLIGMQSPVVVDRDEMYRSNVEKIKWGIDSGRLQKASKGVSKLSIDGVPCLLQDIETQVGARMLTYEFFIPGASKGVFSVCIACDDNPTYIANTRDIETIIKSIRVISK